MKPSTAKTLGAIGSALSATIIGAPIGHILTLIGLRGLGDYYKDEEIKRNTLRWFIWSTIGVIAIVAIYYAGVAALLNSLFAASPLTMDKAALTKTLIEKIYSSIGTLSLILLGTAEIFGVISAIYLRTAYIALFDRGEGGGPYAARRLDVRSPERRPLRAVLLGIANLFGERRAKGRGGAYSGKPVDFKALGDFYLLSSALVITGIGLIFIVVFWALSAKAFSSIEIK